MTKEKKIKYTFSFKNWNGSYSKVVKEFTEKEKDAYLDECLKDESLRKWVGIDWDE